MRAGSHYSGTRMYTAQLKETLKLYHREIMSMGASNDKTIPHGYQKGSSMHNNSWSLLIICRFKRPMEPRCKI